MIVLYKGGRGRGKTLTMVKDGLQYYLEGYRVLSNFQCEFTEKLDNEEILQLDKNSELFNCIILIDEIQIFFDARRGMLKQNLTFSNFVQQIRKRNITILCTTQYSNTIDLRLRQHLDIIAFPSFIERLHLCKVVYMDLTRSEDPQMFIDPDYQFKPATIEIIYNAEPIFKLYDTTEMIT